MNHSEKKARRVGHDLNNLLTAILASTEFGLEDLPPEHVAYTHFEQIKKVTEKAIEIAGQLSPKRKENVPKSRNFEVKSIGGKKVLVVDDDEPVRMVAVKLLNSVGYETISAASAKEALKLFEENPDQINLVLTDVVMPQTNGVEMVTKMKARKPDLPVIFVTGHGLDDHAPEMKNMSEPYTSVAKPFTMQSLIQPIQDMLALSF